MRRIRSGTILGHPSRSAGYRRENGRSTGARLYRESATELISCCVPGFRDETYPAQLRISGELTEDGSVAPIQRAICVTAKHRSQIKAEPVDVHFFFPIS